MTSPPAGRAVDVVAKARQWVRAEIATLERTTRKLAAARKKLARDRSRNTPLRQGAKG